MSRLSAVTKEMASKLLSEVEYGSHLVGSKMHPMSGSTDVILMELEDVLNFFHMGAIETLVIIGGGGVVHYLDYSDLKMWVSNVFGDEELANAIGEEIDKGKCFADTMGPIWELLNERIQQCKTILQIT